MSIKDLIRKEQKFAGYEFQLKIRADITESDLHEIGARKIGSVLHEDRFFILKGKQTNESSELIRIRKEGEENFLFTYKGPVANRMIRNRLVINKQLEKEELSEIKEKYDEIICVSKKRTIFILDEVTINLDKVEKLGNFIEFEVEKEENYFEIISLLRRLGLNELDATRSSYFELALASFSQTQKIFTKISDKFGKFSFGISSAVLTTLGVIVGLNSATNSILAVIASIAAVAIADSSSDSMGMYAAKKAERGTSAKSALKSALNVFIGKLIFTLTFVIPFVIFPLSLAIYVSIIWGILLLIFVSVQIAFIQEESISKTIIKNIIIAVVIIVASYFVGKGVALIS